MKIYESLIQKLELFQKHKDELIMKRGFLDATISKYRFRSSGPYVLNFEAELRSEFPEEELLSSRVFIQTGKQPGINPILLDERIIIPYLDRDGQTVIVRPHKLGLNDIQVEIYHEMNLEGDPAEIVLTEGEFKAVAGMQYGIPTIAIPGISSFSETHFPRLVKLLNDHKVRKVIILFDNEVKDDPKFPQRYKDNPADRYDTDFYAYYMAAKLEREGKETLIAKFPDGWRQDGKIDFDGASAQLKTTGEIKKILFDAKPHREFLRDMPADERQIILRKNAKKWHRSHIKKEFNRYIATRRRGKTEWDEVISNFVIKILATHQTPEGMIREVQFVNEFGQFSSSFSLAADAMSGSDGFRTFCLSRGNFVWRGNMEDLATIWESEFLEDDGRHIIEPDHIGWIESEQMWLFGNIAITKDGKELRPDKNHTFWTEKKGIKPIALGVTTGKNTISEGIPYLNLNQFDMREVKSRLSESIGENMAGLALGWVSAVPFIEEVFDGYGCFPFLFITGRRASGKSTVAEWLMNFYGLENAGKMASDTTQVGIQRYLSYYSSLPVFIDEYRNTKAIKMKDGFFRNSYNRQSAGKGIKADFGIREAKIRGTLILAGEETPEDPALNMRCITILITEKHRLANHFNWFMANRLRFSAHTLDIMRRKKELLPRFLQVLAEGKEYFVKDAGVDDRTAVNYAIVAAGYAAAFGEDIDFAKWIVSEAQRAKSEYQDEQAVQGMFEDLLAIRTRGFVDSNYWKVDANCIYLYFHGLYQVWSQEYRKTRGVEPFKASAIRDYLKEEQGFIDMNQTVRIGDFVKRCVVFDRDKAPDFIKHLVDGTKEDLL